MTPEERARHWIVRNLSGWSDWTREALVEAFREAIAEEREACAQLADSESAWMDGNALDCLCHVRVEELAAAIRARRG